jgi:hypothetical protein
MDGDEIVTRTGIQAEFRPWVFNQHDMEIALASFQFEGLFQNEDQATLVDPGYRIAIYDTDEEYEKRLGTDEEWSLDDKDLVERRLLESRSLGENFVVVPEKTVEPPWPKYDDFEGDATELVLTAVNVIGVPLETMLDYEQSKWGQQREEVIDAIQTAISIRDKERIVVG